MIRVAVATRVGKIGSKCAGPRQPRLPISSLSCFTSFFITTFTRASPCRCALHLRFKEKLMHVKFVMINVLRDGLLILKSPNLIYHFIETDRKKENI